MLSKRTIKKISIIVGIAIIVLWFGGNLGLYLYLQYSFDEKTEKALNYIPEKLKLEEAKVNAQSLNFYKYKIKFPLQRENIKDMFTHFSENMELSLENFLIVIDKGKGFISISDGLYLKDLELSFWDRIIWKEASHFGIIRESYYSRPSDFSWWNLLYNIKLSYHLKIKAILASSDSHVYDLETPFIEGFLTETWAKDIKNKWLIMMTFELKNKYKNIPYSISFAGYGEDKFNKAKALLSTIRPIEDIEEGYKEIEDIYKNIERSQYPEEVLLLSMMSIKGVTRENLEELVEIMERKNYSQYTIDDIKKQLKSFRH